MDYPEELEKAEDIPEVFSLVKRLVREETGKEQAGLLVGIADLGSSSRGLVGAFYSLGSNMIILNRSPLERVKKKKPKLYIPYLFHIMLHEYVHSIGHYDERRARSLVYDISEKHFGKDHVVTEMAEDLSKFLPDLTYPLPGYIKPANLEVEFVKGIDRKGANYIG